MSLEVIYDHGWHGPGGPITEDQAFSLLIRAGRDVHDAYAELRQLKAIGKRECLHVYFVEDARRWKWFVADNDGNGRRTTREFADMLLKDQGCPKRVRDRLLAVAKFLPIQLCDLTPVS